MAKQPIATFDKYENYAQWKRINTKLANMSYYLIDVNTKKIHVFIKEKGKQNAEGSEGL